MIPRADASLASRAVLLAAMLALVVSARGATDSASLVQQAYLKAAASDEFDHFGMVVAVSGDTVVVGAPWEDSGATGVDGDPTDNSTDIAGAASVFVRDASGWSCQDYLKASNTGSADFFGTSVAISGDTLVVGAPGEDSRTTGVDGGGDDDDLTESGAAYVFVRSGRGWSQQAFLKASNPNLGDQFGDSVAICGDTIVVGAPREDGDGSKPGDNSADSAGAAYVFVRRGDSWQQQAYLKASNAEALDHFGTSVDISGDTLVVGAPTEDGSGPCVDGDPHDNGATAAGAAYVFARRGQTWHRQAYLKAADTTGIGIFPGDRFGIAVGVSGDTVVVGAVYEDGSGTGVGGDPTDNGEEDAGAAYVFARSGKTWSCQAYLKASNTQGAPLLKGDLFGRSVAISGDLLVVGAPQEDSAATGIDGDGTDDSSTSSGAAYVFTRTGTSWSEPTYVKASNTGGGDRFGDAVAIDGGTLVVGAWKESSGATCVDGNASDDGTPSAGATYVFDCTAPIERLVVQAAAPAALGAPWWGLAAPPPVLRQ